MIPRVFINCYRNRYAAVLTALLLFLVCGLIAALVIAQLSMSPPGEDLLLLGAYLGLTGAASIAVSWALLVWGPLRSRVGLRSKAFLISTAGSALGLANVLFIAERMFVSTAHDLWVLAASLAFSLAVMAGFSLLVATSIAARVELIRNAVRSLSQEGETALNETDADEVERLSQEVRRLSERLRAAEVERARVDQERRLLTASVSHDLRTPVSSVRAIAEALSSGLLEAEPERQQYIALLQREVERLSRLIDDLFDLAQLDMGALFLQPRTLQFVDIVLDVIDGMKPQAQRSGIELHFEAPAELPCISVDGNRMERVVANLLRNAIEHTPAGGRIDAWLETDGAWLVLKVRDTGSGFETAHGEQIWQRFYRADEARSRQRNSDGAGLGLSIVKGFVEAHGGQVAAASKPGSGSEFTVRLPLKP